jgi:hypothetical protein
MVRTFIVLLVGLPLLMPPGMCVCQFVPCERSDVSAVTPSETDGTAPTCCCARKARRERADARPDASGLTAGDSSVKGSARDRTPSPRPANHDAGCPASLSVAFSKVSPANPLTVAAADRTGESVALPATPTLSFAMTDLAAEGPSALPLYLSHCTLLI